MIRAREVFAQQQSTVVRIYLALSTQAERLEYVYYATKKLIPPFTSYVDMRMKEATHFGNTIMPTDLLGRDGSGNDGSDISSPSLLY